MNKHKKKLLCIISFAVVVSISFVSARSVRADENFRVAKIKSFSGKVKIGKGGGEKTFDAIEGMSLVEGDSITTEKDSSALLYIDDDKEVKIGDNSIVNLSELSGYIDSDEQKTGISLWVGKIFSNIKKKLKIRSKYEIKVPTAVMGVRGTEFSVENSTDGEIKVIVLDGTVAAVRTVVNDSQKETTFEITITKDQSVSMDQNDQAQSDITITGIKVNEASQFVLEILKDFIERNPKSLDESAEKEIYDEIEKRKSEQTPAGENSGDASDIEQPIIRMEPEVAANMALNNVMASANFNSQNMQPSNVLPEVVQGNQLLQANSFNSPATQDRPAPPPQQVMAPPPPSPPPTQQMMPAPVPRQPIAVQPAPVQLPVPPTPIQQAGDRVEPSSSNGGGTTNSNGTNVNPPVTPVNIEPSVQNSSVEISYSTMASGVIIASDVNGDTLSYALGTPARHGTAVVDSATGAWVYTPEQQFTGIDSFVVTVSDGKGGSVASTVTVTVGNASNVAPIVSDDTVTTDYNTAKTGTISATDANNDTLSYSVTLGAGHGTVTVDSSTGAWTYTPTTGFSGIDSFVVTVSDGKGGSVASTVTVTVGNAPNTPPTAQDGSITTLEDTTATGQLTATDVDANTTLTYRVTSNPAHGTVLLNGNGSYSYKPSGDYNGSDSFKFKANDGTADSNEATVNITVTPVNDSPIVLDYNIQTNYGTMATGTISASDPDGDTLSYSVTTGAAVHGTVVVDSTTGGWEYTPAHQFSGIDSFVVTVSDGKGGSATSTVTVTVKPEVIVPPPPNTAPIAQDGSASIFQGTEMHGLLMATDSDINTVLTYTLISQPANGTVTVNSNGSYIYIPNANYSGIDSFTFKANDGVLDSNEATVSIKVMSTNSLNLQNQMQNGNLYFDDTPRLFFDDDIVVPTDLNQIVITDANSNVVPITEASVMDVSILKLYCPSMQSGQYAISISTGVISNTTGTRYNMAINLPFTVDLQGLKDFLSSEVTDTQNLATTTIGSNPGQCSDLSAINELILARANAQSIIQKDNPTIDEINVATNTLQNAVQQVKNNIVNTLNVTTPAAVSVSDNFDAVIEVQPGIGNFSSGLSSSNITLGGSFAGLTIKSVSVSQNSSIAQIELSGILSSSGIGTITINPYGLENPVSLKDIIASVTVNP